jgi:hypothetical protein
LKNRCWEMQSFSTVEREGKDEVQTRARGVSCRSGDSIPASTVPSPDVCEKSLTRAVNS